MEQVLFTNWEALVRTALIGILAYPVLVLFLRVAGKRTLSKLNAFDFVVTVALGSTLAAILLNKDVTLAQGALALALLIGMQFIVTWSSVRAKWVRRLVTGEPSLLVYRGTCLHAALRRTRITDQEVLASVRGAGLSGLDDAEAVVLETDGSMSVIRRNGESTRSSLAGIDIAAVPPTRTRGDPSNKIAG
ncbi:DUF421 domain-containing protein [soil metagenome]